jgi:HEAT repeat protein
LLDQVGAEDPRLRVQVAAALRRVPGEEADRALDRMLADPEPLVRVASAGAILGRAEGLGEATVVVPD